MASALGGGVLVSTAHAQPTAPATPAVAPSPAQATDQVARGKYLATAGDCVACHTVAQDKPFAGGLYMNTPFGAIPTPNITPDKETGIGNWTDDQFYKTFHTGVDPTGRNLYPAFPYQWFTRVTKDDVLAIKAYLFSLQPIHQQNKPLHLVFPFNIRAGLGPWNALYFKEGTFQPDSGKSPEWNRGAYLVEGLGHCASCHTPRNAAMGPIQSEAYTGAKIDNWYAPNITSDTKEGIGAWSIDDLVSYLKTGQARGKTVAIGPMSQTIHDSTSQLSVSDLRAIAVYLKAIPAKETYALDHRATPAVALAGAQIYTENCASCHQPDGQGLANAVPSLAANGAVTAKGPETVIRAILGGVPAQGTFSPMPGFATRLSPQEIADVTNYVRTAWGNAAPANATADMVSTLAPQTRTMLAGTARDKCPPAGTNDVAQAIQSSNIEAELKQINLTNMLETVTSAVQQVRKADPHAQQADIINGLTQAYCPVVIADASIPPQQKSARLDQFSVLAYTQLTDKGRK